MQFVPLYLDQQQQALSASNCKFSSNAITNTHKHRWVSTTLLFTIFSPTNCHCCRFGAKNNFAFVGAQEKKKHRRRKLQQTHTIHNSSELACIAPTLSRSAAKQLAVLKSGMTSNWTALVHTFTAFAADSWNSLSLRCGCSNRMCKLPIFANATYKCVCVRVGKRAYW